MKDRFGLLVFDWDGTLFNSIDWIVECIQRAAAECDCEIPAPSLARSVIGLGLKEAMETLFPGIERAAAERIARAYRFHFRARPITPDDLFAGVHDTLSRLRQHGYLLAVATSKARIGLDDALAATGTAPLFSATRCAGETASKPDPEMLLQLMRQLGIPRHRTVMIGDSIHDLRMANNAEVDAIGVTCGANGQAELSAHRPLACLSTTAELVNMLC
jgi:phosphoglycolate phosphatase